MSPEIMIIPCSQIVPSPANKRKGRTEKIEELAENIRLHGLLSEPLVRPLGDKFEIVAGERRWRACSLIMESMPVKIRELTDSEAHEITFSENFEREDLTALEEAEFVNIMIQDGKTFSEIADRFKTNEKWVARRAKLINLSPEIRSELETGNEQGVSLWSAANLELLARFEHHIQNEIARNFEADETPIKSGELKEYLDSYIMNLSKAPWKLDDEFLSEVAGPCTLCAKRSSLQTNLFDTDENKKITDQCIDRACWNVKLGAFVTIKEQQVREKNPDLITIVQGWGDLHALPEDSDLLKKSISGYNIIDCKKSDPDAKQALVVDGVDAGKLKWVRVLGENKRGNEPRAALTHEERVAKFTKKRRVRVIDKLMGILLKEIAEPDKIIRSLSDEDVAQMAVVWGCRRYDVVADDVDFDVMGDTLKQFDTYSMQRNTVVFSDLARCVLPGIVEILKYHKESKDVYLTFAEGICKILKIDFEKIQRDVELEVKEPKSLKVDNETGNAEPDNKKKRSKGRKPPELPEEDPEDE